MARRNGDYAICGVAAKVELGEVAAVRCAYISMAATPVVLDFGADIAGAPDRARNDLDPEADIHASADYRRHLAGVLTERALTSALLAARGRTRRQDAKGGDAA